MIRSVLFDLDGTLLDTAPDLAAALNAVRVQQGREPLAYELIRPVVSHGGRALIALGFGDIDNADELERLRQSLLDVYSHNIAEATSLFPGMNEVLDYIESQGLQWGVVTNKPSWLTDPLMQALKLDQRARCIISGDTTAYSKPHPGPILHACRCCGHETGECLYIGDAERDIIAGKQAGLTTMIALYGYIPEGENVYAWSADALVESPIEIVHWLQVNQ